MSTTETSCFITEAFVQIFYHLSLALAEYKRDMFKYKT